jgi:hypothetical protein
MPLGDAFYLGSNRNPKLHLYVVVSRPDPAGCVLCVNFSTAHRGPHDTACVVKPGEFAYRFIRHLTFIDYSEAKVIDSEIIRVNLQGRRWSQGEKVPDDLLRKIQSGTKSSDALPVKFQRFRELM